MTRETRPGRTRALWVAVVVASLLGCLVGVVASGLIRSPEQVRAESTPPPPSVLTAPVEDRSLRDTLQITGKVAPSRTTTLPPSGDTGAGGVITDLPLTPGQEVLPGTVIAEVSGRPLIALRGPIPMYRPLRAGLQGGDVTQLRNALADLGLVARADPQDGPPSGVDSPRLDAGLATGVKQLYARVGYSPPAGGMVLPSEIIYVPDLPARVSSVTGKLGAALQGGVVSVSTGPLIATATVNAGDMVLIEPGQKVTGQLELDGKRVTLTGRVAALKPVDGKGQSGDGVAAQGGGGQVQLALDDPPASASGKNVLFTVTRKAATTARLLVPVTALSQRSDGAQTVTVVDGSRRTDVAVRAGALGDGYVEVFPAAAGTLRAGDRVLVGRS